ncbi:MAG: DUF362 domain-containing protein [Clostridia bacterium]|nr:DUF362 domain-containing protein [Clostridia bacterium]
MKNNTVAVLPLDDYDYDQSLVTLKKLLESIDDFSWLKPGMTVGIKVNLVASMKPEEAGTTNPILVKALCKILIEKGAKVVVGDSPGGLFTPSHLNTVYKVTQMTMVEEVGASLNQNFNQLQEVFVDAKVCKTLDSCEWLKNCDALINFCKLKTHGMMAMSSAVKNLFGTIGGTLKPEYHFRYPNIEDFASMLVDINEFYKCKLNIVDAVIGMEGNGPTQGKPRKIGCVLASKSPYDLDYVCAKIIGLDPETVPTITDSQARNLCSKTMEEVDLIGEINNLIITDFDLIKKLNSIEFENQLKGIWGKMFGKIAKTALQNKPSLCKKECIKCKKCYNICPAKAITMKKYPKINRKKCIKCFCCQEFCPKGAMKVKRPLIARILNKKK